MQYIIKNFRFDVFTQPFFSDNFNFFILKEAFKNVIHGQIIVNIFFARFKIYEQINITCLRLLIAQMRAKQTNVGPSICF